MSTFKKEIDATSAVAISTLQNQLMNSLNKFDELRRSISKLQVDAQTDENANEKMEKLADYLVQHDVIAKMQSLADLSGELQNSTQSYKHNLTDFTKFIMTINKEFNLKMPEDAIDSSMKLLTDLEGNDKAKSKSSIAKNRKFV